MPHDFTDSVLNDQRDLTERDLQRARDCVNERVADEQEREMVLLMLGLAS